jgi:predicted protein tyrosine phosphatase
MHDIIDEQEGFVAPAREHVEALLAFAHDWDRTKPMIVHCYAGISRSTAAAYVIAAALNPMRDAAGRQTRRQTCASSRSPTISSAAGER